VVSEHGVATALQEGQSHIVVSIEGATAEATLVVTDSSPRPVEILNVVPFENETVSLSGPECLYVFPPCKLPQLSFKEKDILSSRLKKVTLEIIGSKYAVTEARIRQIERAAIRKIKNKLYQQKLFNA